LFFTTAALREQNSAHVRGTDQLSQSKNGIITTADAPGGAMTMPMN
jgi:hypothetical protein